MAARVKPSLDRLYRKVIRGVNLDFSKRSIVYAEVPNPATQCPNCVFDQTNGNGSGVYNTTGPQPFSGGTCPVCSNIGKLNTSKRIQVAANLKWGPNDGKGNEPGSAGYLKDGQAHRKVTIENRSIIDSAVAIWADGVRCNKIGEGVQRGLLTYLMVQYKIQRDD